MDIRDLRSLSQLGIPILSSYMKMRNRYRFFKLKPNKVFQTIKSGRFTQKKFEKTLLFIMRPKGCFYKSIELLKIMNLSEEYYKIIKDRIKV